MFLVIIFYVIRPEQESLRFYTSLPLATRGKQISSAARYYHMKSQLLIHLILDYQLCIRTDAPALFQLGMVQEPTL